VKQGLESTSRPIEMKVKRLKEGRSDVNKGRMVKEKEDS
jgi:hypothetical protein